MCTYVLVVYTAVLRFTIGCEYPATSFSLVILHVTQSLCQMFAMRIYRLLFVLVHYLHLILCLDIGKLWTFFLIKGLQGPNDAHKVIQILSKYSTIIIVDFAMFAFIQRTLWDEKKILRQK